MNRLPVIASFVCAMGAAVGGYFMVPGEGERLAMLVRDGQGEIALEKANDLFARGVRDPALLLQAFFLNQRAGEYDRASEILDAYLKQRPDDAVTWRALAEAFEASGQSEQLRNALENVVRLTRDSASASQLSAIYRLRGDDENELRVLGMPEAAGLAEADAIRLAHLLAVRGRSSEVAGILGPLDGKAPGLSDEGRIQLFTALLDRGEFTKAVDRALVWQKDKKRLALQDVFVGYLLRTGADEEALRLATSRESIDDAKLMARVAQLLSDNGRYDLVERVVREWLAYAQKLPVDQLDAYLAEVVNIARAKGAGNRLFGDLLTTMARHGSPEVEASFAQTMYDQLGYVGIAPFRYAIGPRVLLIRPVFAARLFTVERNALAARRFLMATYLPDQQAKARFEWLAMAQEMLSPQELGSELARRAQAGAIPPEMKRAILDAMPRDGSRQQTMAVWQSFFDTGKPNFEALPKPNGPRIN
ncbi:tetratricopeptide repeat protein [Mesorhizobium sp. ASY16-5R]|uniref:tetratricopeptide repeat protein n=1 Tax=Mesorhizobium sp. ASY16-5R TaxID=3445772 RepID=UPI003F9FC1F8